MHPVLEVADGAHRDAVIDHVTAGVKEDQPVKHLEDIRGGLMDDDEDQFPLEFKVVKQVKDVLRVE